MGDAIESAREVRVTTAADAAWKSTVEPYAERSPVLDIPTGVVACQFCGNTRFRRSRVRLGDVIELFLLRLPLRCMRCNQRQYGSFMTASVATGTKANEPRLSRQHETWQAWTGQEMARQHRPMTTAIGSRANNLHSTARVAQAVGEPAVPIAQPIPNRDDSQIW